MTDAGDRSETTTRYIVEYRSKFAGKWEPAGRGLYFTSEGPEFDTPIAAFDHIEKRRDRYHNDADAYRVIEVIDKHVTTRREIARTAIWIKGKQYSKNSFGDNFRKECVWVAPNGNAALATLGLYHDIDIIRVLAGERNNWEEE